MENERARIETGVRQLTAWAAGTRLEDVPAATLHRMVVILADDLGAMVAARDEPEVRRIHEQLLGRPGVREATVFRGGRPRTDRFSAAVANGAAADWCELDSGYRKAVCHGGVYALPALMAEAEAERLSLGELLRAAVIAYEVVARFARTWTFAELVHHPHATLPAVAAAAAIAAARRVDGEVFLNAITAASTLIAVGPWDHAVKGALVRNVWPAAGAWNGMHCVDWAQCGIGGLPGTPHDIFSRALGGQAHPEVLTADLGTAWAVHDSYHKMYACCQYAHSSVEAALALRPELPAPDLARQVRTITMDVHRHGLTLNNFAPQTTLGAKFSIPHAVAAALHFGSAGAEGFAASTLADPSLERLRSRVQLRLFEPELPFPNDRPARITVALEDGRSFTSECMSARGGPDRPFSEEEIFGKVEALTAPVYPAFARVVRALDVTRADHLNQPWDAFLGRLLEPARTAAS